MGLTRFDVWRVECDARGCPAEGPEARTTGRAIAGAIAAGFTALEGPVIHRGKTWRYLCPRCSPRQAPAPTGSP